MYRTRRGVTECFTWHCSLNGSYRSALNRIYASIEIENSKWITYDGYYCIVRDTVNKSNFKYISICFAWNASTFAFSHRFEGEFSVAWTNCLQLRQVCRSPFRIGWCRLHYCNDKSVHRLTWIFNDWSFNHECHTHINMWSHFNWTHHFRCISLWKSQNVHQLCTSAIVKPQFGYFQLQPLDKVKMQSKKSAL